MTNFLIIAPINCVTYKEVFPLIKENKMWTGYNFNKTMYFEMPGTYSGEDAGNGNKIGKVPAICWLTNLEHNKRRVPLELTKTYNPEEYPKYDNYNAIEVSKVAEIPMDYMSVIGVPITFLDKYCPEQFEIVWTTDRGGDGKIDDLKNPNWKGLWDSAFINGNKVYKRILIRKVKEN